jgi:hypothetical protein
MATVLQMGQHSHDAVRSRALAYQVSAASTNESQNAPLQAMTLLSDGRVFTIGGSWNGGIFIKNGEIWSEAEGWKLLPGCPVGPSPEPLPFLAHR